MGEEKVNLCKFDGQLYFCKASKLKYQEPCKHGLKSPHRDECVYYNCGMEDRCDNRKACRDAFRNYLD